MLICSITDIGVVSPVTFSDDSIFPYSCCDLSTIDASSECPSDQVPSLGRQETLVVKAKLYGPISSYAIEQIDQANFTSNLSL